MAKSQRRIKILSARQKRRAQKEASMKRGGKRMSRYARKKKLQAGGTFSSTSPFCNPLCHTVIHPSSI